MPWHAIFSVSPVLGGLCRPLLFPRVRRQRAVEADRPKETVASNFTPTTRAPLHARLHACAQNWVGSSFVSKILWVFLLRS